MVLERARFRVGPQHGFSKRAFVNHRTRRFRLLALRPGTRLCSSRFLQATTTSRAPSAPHHPATMEGDASPRFPPDDRVTCSRTIRSRPASSSTRYFLSGWTLARYTERFRREAGDGEASSADEGDGATPVGSGAFGWTAEGPPGRRRARRRRPRGVLTIPTRATVGQVRYRRGPSALPRF